MTTLALTPAAFSLLDGFAWALPTLFYFAWKYLSFWASKWKYSQDQPSG